MTYDLTIDDRNKQCHVDIEEDIRKQSNGVFTFTLRVNDGVVIDYTVTEYADATKFLRLNKLIIEQLTVAFTAHPGDQRDKVRTTDS